LHLPSLKAHLTPGLLRKLSQRRQTVAHEFEVFHGLII
jgi:hypothetical protein